MVDEGIITREGLYFVRYFLGGSGCCVAESKLFRVSKPQSVMGWFKFAITIFNIFHGVRGEEGRGGGL